MAKKVKVQFDQYGYADTAYGMTQISTDDLPDALKALGTETKTAWRNHLGTVLLYDPCHGIYWIDGPNPYALGQIWAYWFKGGDKPARVLRCFFGGGSRSGLSHWYKVGVIGEGDNILWLTYTITTLGIGSEKRADGDHYVNIEGWGTSKPFLIASELLRLMGYTGSVQSDWYTIH